MKNVARLREFVVSMTGLAERQGDDELAMLRDGGKLLGALIAHDDWLPEMFAAPHLAHYQEFLLYCDPLERFSVVSLALGPNQRTPIHEHTVWCLIGVIRGTVHFDEYRHEGVGVALRKTGEHLGQAGDIDAVSPTVGDIHVMSNALRDQAAVSIHAFGGNIGAIERRAYNLATGEPHVFRSGYANSVVPNLWDRSLEVHA